jgi:autotransporter translocation and assembly factor TamB
MQTDSFLWEGAPQLNIVQQQTEEASGLVERPSYWPRGTWDVNLYANNRANLYGQGISAELSGDLVVTDDLYEPVIAGQFSLVRGTYTGLGRVFQLSSGSVLIQNNQMVMDIQGEHLARMEIDGNQQVLPITLRITGTRDALNLTLSSNANLDQDELLAQLLFGKIVDELDVFQAVQLANVVNKLRTGNSGFDIIGATRDSFALDTLVVDTESNEEGELNFNISAGKYLNDFLYLEVEQDVGSEQEFRGSIQYQVTPNTNLEVYTQGQGGAFEDNGIEFNWSWDY